MKSEVIKGKPINNGEYPKLMVVKALDNKGTVVLFSEYRIGTVVHGVGNHVLGEKNDKWWMDNFVDFTGKVVLSNDG